MTKTSIEPEIDSPDLPADLPDKAVRQAGINIGGNTVTQATEHLPEHQRTLLRAVHAITRDNKWDWADLARETAVSQSTWWRLWTDTYRYPKESKDNFCPACKRLVKVIRGGRCLTCHAITQDQRQPHPKASERVPLDSLCEKIAKWKEIWDQRAILANTAFVETSVWQRVDWICRRAFIRKKIGFIYGESQIGKSTCLKEHARRNNTGLTTYLEMPPAAGVQLMTRKIAQALHVATGTCFERLIDDVTDALDHNKLLIIDEIHRVFTTYQKTSVMRCLDVLRYIHDQTHCGLILCGTHVFRDQLQQGQFFQYLKQLKRRGIYELQLPPDPPREDLDLIASAHGLHPAAGAAEEVMLEIALADGFGKYCTRLEDAVELAAKKKQPLSWDHFIKAHTIAEKMAAKFKPPKPKVPAVKPLDPAANPDSIGTPPPPDSAKTLNPRKTHL